MSSSGLILSDLLPSSALNMGAALGKFFGDESQPPARADFLGNLAEKRVREVLNVSVLDILLRAWEKCRVVAEALEATRNSPGTTEMVELLEHEVETTEHPELYIELSGRRCSPLRLDLEIVASLRGAILEVADGAVRSVELGELEMHFGLKYKEIQLLPDWDVGPIKLPGTLHLTRAAPPSRFANGAEAASRW